MADSDSSDVLANLPAGRPARRSSRRGVPGAPATTSASGKSAPAKPSASKATAAAKPKTAAATTAATKSTAAKSKSTAATKSTATKSTAAKPTAKSTPAKATAAKAKATAASRSRTTAASKSTAAKKPAARTPAKKQPTAAATPAADTATAATPTPRRPRIAKPPEGRRADFSAGSAMHRARKVTTNRPWLPSSGYSLPESKDRPPLGLALEGLAGAIGDVARVSIGIAQSLTAKRRRDSELTTPDAETEETRTPSKS